MTTTMNCIKKIEKNEVYQEVKKHFLEKTGFYFKSPNGKTFRIDRINLNNQNTIKNYDNYGVALRAHEKAPEVIAASFPSSEIALECGLEVYYGGIANDKVARCHKGCISSIEQDNNKQTIFTIDGASVTHYVGSPVFTYDKIQKVLILAGVIVSQTEKDNEMVGRAAHINMFKQVQELTNSNSIKKENIQSANLWLSYGMLSEMGHLSIQNAGESTQPKYDTNTLFFSPSKKEVNTL